MTPATTECRVLTEGWDTPKFPAPTGVSAPSWATETSDWHWRANPDRWQRWVTRCFRLPKGGGFDLDQHEGAREDGTIERGEIVVSIEIHNDEIDNAADARQLGQWLIAAADELDRINFLPAQRAP